MRSLVQGLAAEHRPDLAVLLEPSGEISVAQRDTLFFGLEQKVRKYNHRAIWTSAIGHAFHAQWLTSIQVVDTLMQKRFILARAAFGSFDLYLETVL